MSRLKRLDPHVALIAAIVVFGVLLRMLHFLLVDARLPYAYGGLYLEFAHQIAQNGYRLPETIPFYTLGGIPYAYPPLPFYVEALALDLLKVPWYVVVNWLPVIVASVALVSYAFFVRALRLSWSRAWIAVGAYATMLAAFAEQVEGAGLAESFGSLALIWTGFFLVRCARSRTAGDALGVGVMLGLCVLASPGSAYASLPTFGIFALVMLARREWRLVGLAAAGWVLVSAPYLATVIYYHGIRVFVEPLTLAHEAGSLGIVVDEIVRFLRFQVEGRDYSFFWSALVFYGAVRAFAEQEWPVLAWFVVLFAIPQEGVWMASIPAAILAGMGGAGLLEAFQDRLPASGGGWRKRLSTGLIVMAAGGFVLGSLFFNLGGLSRPDANLTQPQLAALEWARSHTDEDQVFLIMASSAALEWAPEIARRTVLNEPFGAEWEPAEYHAIVRVNEALADCGDLACVVALASEIGYAGDSLCVLWDQAVFPKLNPQSDSGIRVRELYAASGLILLELIPESA